MKDKITLIKEYTEEIFLTGPEIVAQELEIFSKQKKEFFIAFYLDTLNKIISREIISIGTLNSGLVHPREVFKGAILCSANSIILAHNHPSGDLTPSEEDLKVTKMLKNCGELLGIKVLDNLIISEKGYFSIIDEV